MASRKKNRQRIMGAITGEYSLWLWFGVLLHLLYEIFIWVWIFLPTVGEFTNSGAFDPSVIKWFLFAAAVLAFVLLVISFFAGIAWSRERLRQSATLWHFVEATFLLIFITVWAFLWDDRNAGLFPGGVPVMPVQPIPCLAACQTNLSLQQLAFIEWKTILILAVVFVTFIVVSIVHGWRMLLASKSYSTLPTNNKIGLKNKNKNKRKNGKTLTEDVAEFFE